MATAPTSYGGAKRGYRVAAPIAGHWRVTGPTFNNRDEASAHMEGVRFPFKRIVAITIPTTRHDHVPVPNLDRNRLAFARFLVETGRLHEFAGDAPESDV